MPGITRFVQPQKAQYLAGLFFSISRVFGAALDLVFPPRCAGCGKVDTHWCATCNAEIDLLPPSIKALPTDSPLSALLASGPHEGRLRNAVHAFKYENAQQLGAFPLGKRLFTTVAGQSWTFDIIIPVPLHTTRLRERGYNQSQILAEQLAGYTMKPHLPHALRRIRETRSQVGLNAAQRQENTADAFLASRALVSGQNVLLIDDVYTTGATLAACSRAIKRAGAHKIFGLTITAAND